jgi:hypothetical protein
MLPQWGSKIFPERRVLVVDIDGTVCTKVDGDNYAAACPIPSRIRRVNEMKQDGWYVVFWTARGGTTGKDWRGVTMCQLDAWGVLYDELHFAKPHYDLWIDDKAESANWLDGIASDAQSR